MDHVIKGKNTAVTLKIMLAENERVIASPRHLIATSGDIRIAPLGEAGLLRHLAEKFKGKTLAFDTLQAIHDKAWVLLCPPVNGAVTAVDLYPSATQDKEIFLRQDLFLAAQATIMPSATLPRHVQTLSDTLSTAFLSIKGKGPVFFCGHGAVETVQVNSDTPMRIDSAYLVAWDSDVTCAPVKAGLFTSKKPAQDWGEGKNILEISGDGRIWLQTRTITSD